MSSVPTCDNCGAALYRQWWSKSIGAYECRHCGALTAGPIANAGTDDSPSAPGQQAAPSQWSQWVPPQPAQWAPPPVADGAAGGGLVFGIAMGLGAFLLLLAASAWFVLAFAIGLIVVVLAARDAASRARISALERRLSALAAAQVASAPRAAQIESAASPVPAAASPVAAEAAPPLVPASPVQPPAPPILQPPLPPRPPSAFELTIRRLQSASAGELEELVAGRLLPIVGGIALVSAAILFLGLAFTRGWIGEEGRVVIGLVAGIVPSIRAARVKIVDGLRHVA